MAQALLTAVVIGLAGLVTTAVYGLLGNDVARHISFGIFSTMITLLAHSMMMFYLIGKGKAVKDAMAEYHLDGDYYRRIAAARISIFTLDVSDADYHSLETTLRVVSDQTGGIYEKTHRFPGLAMERVSRAISGHYILVFRNPEGSRGFHSIHVELVGRKGQVTARTYYED